MRMQIYAIRDFVAHESGPLFEAKNDEVALRQFDRLVKDSENRNDFELFCVGSYDHESDILLPQTYRPVVPTLGVENDPEEDVYGPDYSTRSEEELEEMRK